jgi:hypothetical protein
MFSSQFLKQLFICTFLDFFYVRLHTHICFLSLCLSLLLNNLHISKIYTPPLSFFGIFYFFSLNEHYKAQPKAYIFQTLYLAVTLIGILRSSFKRRSSPSPPLLLPFLSFSLKYLSNSVYLFPTPLYPFSVSVNIGILFQILTG